MAVPKRRVTSSRAGKRAAHQALKRRQLYTCPNCDQSIRPHTVCGNCGFYRKAVVMKTHDEEAG